MRCESGTFPSAEHTPVDRIDYLDGWRGLAILLVLDSHFLNWLPVESGRLGVDIFFCLSGFLMSKILFVQRVPLDVFYKRRISRIAPAFAIFVLIVYMFATFSGVPWTWPEIGSTLIFLRTYIPSQPGIWNTDLPIGHLWSLNVEEHCYVFMSLLVLIRVLRGREEIVLSLAALMCVATGVVYAMLGTTVPASGALGTEVAASHLLFSSGYFLFKRKLQLHCRSWMPLIALAGAIFCYTKLLPWWAHLMISPLLLAVAVNHLSDAPVWFLNLLSLRWLRMLGLWSFSIYLWQQPFHAWKNDFIGGSGFALVAAVIAGLFSFYVIEKPTRSWLNANW